MTRSSFRYTQIPTRLDGGVIRRYRANTAIATMKSLCIANASRTIGIVLAALLTIAGFQASALTDSPTMTWFDWRADGGLVEVEDRSELSLVHRQLSESELLDRQPSFWPMPFGTNKPSTTVQQFNNALYDKPSTTTNDSNGSSATRPFQVTRTANASPELNEKALSMRLPTYNTVNVGQLIDIDLVDLFNDPEADDAVDCCTVSTSDESVMLVVKTMDGAVATVVGRSAGNATLSLIATDKANHETVVDIDLRINARPKESMPLGPQTLTRVAPLVLDVSSVFTDQDHDAESLRIAANAIGDGADRVILSLVDGKLAIMGVKGVEPGDVEVKLYALDPFGASATSTFVASVNNVNPTLADAQTLNVGPLNLGDPVAVNLNDTFKDQDGEISALVASTPVDSAVSVSPIDLADGILTLTGRRVGETSVTLTAIDNDGGTVKTTFKVTVNRN